MVRQFIIAAGAVCLSTSCAIAQETEADVPGWLSKDFVELVEHFEGHWNNDRHVFFAEDAGMDLSPIAPRQHISITRSEEEGEDGAVVFQADRSIDGGAPASLFHSFSIAADKSVIVQTMSPALGEADAPDCNVEWQRAGAQFQGRASGEGCEVLFPRPEGEGDLSVTMTLSENDFWVRSSRGEAFTEARFRRARPFECWTAILRGASHGDSGEGMRDWDFRRGVRLHDQGGEAELMTDEETPRKIRLKLRNVDWPYGTNRPSLTLYIMEGDSDRAVSYAWNEGNAERIGINLRWIQASCTHAPDAD